MCKVQKVLETPYSFHDRTAGESKLSTKVSLEYIKQLFHLRKVAVNRGRGMRVARWSPEKLAEKVGSIRA